MDGSSLRMSRICEWMKTQEDMKLMSGDYAIHLDLVAKVRGLSSAQKFFTDLPEKMINPIICSALLHTYVQHNESEKAEALMKKMAESDYLKSPVPHNHMIDRVFERIIITRIKSKIRKGFTWFDPFGNRSTSTGEGK